MKTRFRVMEWSGGAPASPAKPSLMLVHFKGKGRINYANSDRLRRLDGAGDAGDVQRALSIYEQMLGPKHASTAGTLNNLALLLQAQGNLINQYISM
jgi:hypothetical protein